MSALGDTARSGFREQFGAGAIGVWSAPGRVNLIGEHTDYNDGFVFPFAIDRRTAVAVGLRADRLLRVASSLGGEPVSISLDALRPEALSGWSAYPLGVAWALGECGANLTAVSGLDLYFHSDVPVGAGLSSSAAIESAAALAMNELWALGFDRQSLAKVGQRAENVAVGAPTGIMDQSASLLGETDAGVFLDCRSLEAHVIDLGFAAANLELLIIDTRVEHAHATGGYAARRASCEAGAKALGVPSLRDLDSDDLERARSLLDDETFRRVRHVVTENERVLQTVRQLREHGPRAIGELLLASHASMRDDFEISVPQLDLAVEAAMAAGAIGARMTGGGFGGAAIALVERDLVEATVAAVESAFAERGYTAPECFVVRADRGAVREA